MHIMFNSKMMLIMLDEQHVPKLFMQTKEGYNDGPSDTQTCLSKSDITGLTFREFIL